MPIFPGNPMTEVVAVRLDVAGASGSSGVFASIGNPFGRSVIITRAILYLSTAAGAAATVDIGVGASASTSNDGLFDGLDVNSATGVFDNLNDTHNGTNGAFNQLWTATTFLNVAEASGNVNSMVAQLIVQAVPV